MILSRHTSDELTEAEDWAWVVVGDQRYIFWTKRLYGGRRAYWSRVVDHPVPDFFNPNLHSPWGLSIKLDGVTVRHGVEVENDEHWERILADHEAIVTMEVL